MSELRQTSQAAQRRCTDEPPTPELENECPECRGGSEFTNHGLVRVVGTVHFAGEAHAGVVFVVLQG